MHHPQGRRITFHAAANAGNITAGAFTPHVSRFTFYVLRFTHYASRITHYFLPHAAASSFSRPSP
jgi:hypothetical protein